MPTDAKGQGPAVIVIGGAAGIGGAILEEIARHTDGAHAWITYHSDPAAAKDLAARIPGCRAARCDLNDRASIDELARQVGTAGATHVQALVHAGVEARRGTLYQLGAGSIGDVVRSSALSLLDVTQAFDRLLGEGSTILFLTSMGARRAIPDYGAVGIAKAAGEALVRYLAVELAPRGVRVNSISPGAVRTKAFDAMFQAPDHVIAQMTERSPRKKALSLNEIAYVARTLCDPRCSGISGQVITIDGGYYAMR